MVFGNLLLISFAQSCSTSLYSNGNSYSTTFGCQTDCVKKPAAFQPFMPNYAAYFTGTFYTCAEGMDQVTCDVTCTQACSYVATPKSTSISYKVRINGYTDSNSAVVPGGNYVCPTGKGRDRKYTSTVAVSAGAGAAAAVVFVLVIVLVICKACCKTCGKAVVAGAAAGTVVGVAGMAMNRAQNQQVVMQAPAGYPQGQFQQGQYQQGQYQQGQYQQEQYPQGQQPMFGQVPSQPMAPTMPGYGQAPQNGVTMPVM